MAEPTQGYSPIQVDTRPPSVGAVPELRVDKTLDIISKYAEELNSNNIVSARQELYVQGKARAAQGESIKEMREQQSPINTLFGGGASLSGAMDYREQDSIQKYKTQTIKDMDTLREQYPEEFVANQQEAIKQFYTDDDRTNARIMASFNEALPTMSALHAKEHEKYIQETHLNSITKSATSAIEAYSYALSTGNKRVIEQATADMGTSVLQPAGMNDAAYKKFLYGMAAEEAASGNEVISTIIHSSGLINDERDVKKIDEMNAARQGARFAQKSNEFVDVYDQGLNAAPNMTREEISQLITQLTVNYGGKLATPARMGALYKAKLKGIKAALAKKAIDIYVNEFYAHGNMNLPPNKSQETMNVAYQLAKEDPELLPKYYEALIKSSTPNTQMKNAWSSYLAMPVKVDDEGNYLLTEQAESTIKQVDVLYKMDKGTAMTHLDQDSAALYGMYRLVRESDPTNSEAVWMQRAQAGVAVKATGVSLTKKNKEITAAVFDGLGIDEDNLNMGAEAAILAAADTLNATYGNTAAATGALEHVFNSRYEVRDGNIYTKVDGKSLAERSGCTAPFAAAMGAFKARTHYTGTPVVTVSGSSNTVTVMAKDGSAAITMSLDYLKSWQQQGEDPITTEHYKNLEEYKSNAKAAVIKKLMTDDLMDTQYDDYEYGTMEETTTVEERVESMSDETLLTMYEDIRTEERAKGTVAERITAFFSPLLDILPKSSFDADFDPQEVIDTSIREDAEVAEAEEQATSAQGNSAMTTARATVSSNLSVVPVPAQAADNMNSGVNVQEEVNNYFDKAFPIEIADAIKMVAAAEQFNSAPYADPAGTVGRSIGYGFQYIDKDGNNAARPELQAWADKHGGHYDSMLPSDAAALLAQMVRNDRKAAQRTYTTFNAEQIKGITNSYYQLGRKHFNDEFPTAVRWLHRADAEPVGSAKRQKYLGYAALEFTYNGDLDAPSDWYTQTESRVLENMRMIAGDEWTRPDEYGIEQYVIDN